MKILLLKFKQVHELVTTGCALSERSTRILSFLKLINVYLCLGGFEEKYILHVTVTKMYDIIIFYNNLKSLRS